MNRNISSRSGSALLVVLGMLSFMLFSGLAFSVYMRYSRLPTSFLRRTATSRQLVKAALAEAIDQIDRGIANDVHPGVRKSGRTFYADSFDNLWSHRVFFGLGTTLKPESLKNADDSAVYPDIADPSETVSTLSLESLAYVPPNLINEVRYYSQRTPTAKWHSFWFDSGRYAYTALDVSDYFDVNRLLANRARSSAGSGRISLSYIFEDRNEGEHTGVGNPDKWDTFMSKFRSVDDKTGTISEFTDCPLVSLADFNLAWGSQKFGDIDCPFNNLMNSTGGDAYNCGFDQEDGLFTSAEADAYSSLTFVTDGLFPQVAKKQANGKVFSCSLDNAKFQPFKMNNLAKEELKPSIDNIATYAYSDSGMQTWAVNTESELRLNHLNFAALWDYLDYNSVPCSLCIPTVERTPMICGIEPTLNGNVELKIKASSGTPVDGEKKVQASGLDGYWDMATVEVTYSIDANSIISAAKGAKALLLYPFRTHGLSAEEGAQFKVDGRYSVFFTLDGQDASIRSSQFTPALEKTSFTQADVANQSLLSFPLAANEECSPKSMTETKTDTFGKVRAKVYDLISKAGGNFDADELVLAKVRYKYNRYKVDEEGNKIGNELPPHPGQAGTTLDGDVTPGKFCILDSDGSLISVDKSIKNALSGTPVKLHANIAVWLRVTDQDGESVDLVPACSDDDKNILGANETSKITKDCGGGAYGKPLMRIKCEDGENGLTLSSDKLAVSDGSSGSSLGNFSLTPTKLLIADPRYNYAPENWVISGDEIPAPSGSGTLAVLDWTSNDKIAQLIRNGDGDAYMSTSDVGYMQSIYELAFLPRTTDGFNADARGDVFRGKLRIDYDRSDFPTKFTGSASEAAFNAERMWRTYSPYKQDGEFTELESIMDSGEGFKVNPYSDSTPVLMAAFANTPYDWRCASTNEDSFVAQDNSGIGGSKRTAKEFNMKYAWNGYGGSERICWNCLSEVADTFSDEVRKNDDWETAFGAMGWSNSGSSGSDGKPWRKLLSSMDDMEKDDSDVYSVDRKFFYGFWHDCFAARQQLFLIFVRAEPMMMGGGVNGEIPPQLGAKAVALVWRDPTATTGTRKVTVEDDEREIPNPHRTRILFYHQFD